MVDTKSYYGDFITSFDEVCRKSIVRIESQSTSDPNKKVVRTGVVIAETDQSCIIMTASDIYRKNEVEFYDGTKKLCVPSCVSISKNFNLAVIPVFNHGKEHWQTANFSDNEVRTGQKVFTCGFNSDSKRNFISGGSVCGVNVANEESKIGTVFIHSCTTGSEGYAGSAVFNDAKELVGLNYVPSNLSLCDASASPSSSTGGLTSKSRSRSEKYGGLVSALHLFTIKCGLADMYSDTKDKSLQQTLEYLSKNLKVRDSKLSAP